MNVLLLYRAALISIDGRFQLRAVGSAVSRGRAAGAGGRHHGRGTGTPPDPIMEELASAKRSVNAIFYEQVNLSLIHI